MFKLKRIYEEPTVEDGVRILIDRLWPRGLTKEQAHIDHWLKDIAPSAELRKWFGHCPERFEAFKKRYEEELNRKPEKTEALSFLEQQEQMSNITLVYAAKNPVHNHSVVLKDVLQKRGMIVEEME